MRHRTAGLRIGPRLRLYLADREPTATWEFERELRHRWAVSGARV